MLQNDSISLTLFKRHLKTLCECGCVVLSLLFLCTVYKYCYLLTGSAAVYCSESDDELLSPESHDSTVPPADGLTTTHEDLPSASTHEAASTTASREGTIGYAQILNAVQNRQRAGLV